MESDENQQPRTVSRRSMVASGAALGVGAWVAPSILSYDRAAAAIGSCGTKPRQVDFSDWAGALVPTSFTAADGVTITMSIDDGDGVHDSFWAMRVFNGTINGRDNPAITGMSNAEENEGVTVTFTFSTPVAPSFFLVDVDRGDFSWEDTVDVRGFLNSGPRVDPDSFTPGGGAVTQINPRRVRGLSPSNSSNSEVEVDFQEPINELVIRHFDRQDWSGFQWIGIHDLHWC
ncbi:MAG: hypothetical protein AAF081_19745 [Actinomycetota bacterium]